MPTWTGWRCNNLAYKAPHTAPVYDKLTDPQSVPAPQACVETASKGCKCFTNQATPIQMEQDLCHRIVENGLFIGWQPAAGTQLTQAQTQPNQETRP